MGVSGQRHTPASLPRLGRSKAEDFWFEWQYGLRRGRNLVGELSGVWTESGLVRTAWRDWWLALGSRGGGGDDDTASSHFSNYYTLLSVPRQKSNFCVFNNFIFAQSVANIWACCRPPVVTEDFPIVEHDAIVIRKNNPAFRRNLGGWIYRRSWRQCIRLECR
jgi:hypothetical protein